jgi:hypothetical protein
MKKGGVDIALLLLTVIFLVPSTFHFEPPAIPIGEFYVTIVELCIGALLVRWAAVALLRPGRGPRTPFTLPVTILLGIIAVSIASGIPRYGATRTLGDARQYLPLALYFWAMRRLANVDRLEAVRHRMFAVLAIVGLYVVVIFLFFRGQLAAYAATKGARVIEDRVVFDNTLFILFLYAGYILNRLIVAREMQPLLMGLLVVNVVMLVVMQVRTYWIAFFVIAAVIAWSERRTLLHPRMALKAALGVPLILAGVLALKLVDNAAWGNVGTSISERVTSLIQFRETFLEANVKTTTEVETLGTRRETARAVLNDYILPNPVFGIGLGGELPMVNSLGSTVMMKYQIDNGFLTILAKFGLVGFLLYGLVVLQVARRLVRVLRSSVATEEERMLARSLLAGVAAVLIASGFSSVFVRQQPSIVAFLLLLAETTVLTRSVRARKAAWVAARAAPAGGA